LYFKWLSQIICKCVHSLLHLTPPYPFLFNRHYPYMAWCKNIWLWSNCQAPIILDTPTHMPCFSLLIEKTAKDVRHVTTCCILKPTVKIVWQCMYIPPSTALPIFQQISELPVCIWGSLRSNCRVHDLPPLSLHGNGRIKDVSKHNGPSAPAG